MARSYVVDDSQILSAQYGTMRRREWVPPVWRRHADPGAVRIQTLRAIANGSRPAAGEAFDRADVEYLVFYALSKGNSFVLNFSGSVMRGIDLSGIPFSGHVLDNCNLENTNLSECRFSRCSMLNCRLNRTTLHSAQLQACDLRNAEMRSAGLQCARLNHAHLSGADLARAQMSASTLLGRCRMAENGVGPRLISVEWNGAIVADANWEELDLLGGDPAHPRGPARIEQVARRIEQSEGNQMLPGESIKSAVRRRRETGLRDAITEYRQVAAVLRSQGRPEVSQRLELRARRLGRRVRGRRGWIGFRITQFVSWCLDVATGYGTAPERMGIFYVCAIAAYAILYAHLSTPESFSFKAPWEPVVLSVLSFHGRGLVGNPSNAASPAAVFSASEGILGLVMEATFVAALTRRLFGD